MKYKKLGNSGLLVSEFALGTMTFGGGAGWMHVGGLGLSDVKRLLIQAIDAGINLIDTADYYSVGASEQLLGEALAQLGIPRDQVLIATKARLRMGLGVNQVGSSRYHLFNAVDASLRRLKIDHVDIFQLHAVDPDTPLEETLDALNDLIKAGKIRYSGFCNFPAWYAAKAQVTAQLRGKSRFVSMQIYYNAAIRDAENDLLPMAEDLGIGVLVWSPLAGGLLTGKYQRGEQGRRSNFPFPPVDDRVHSDVMAILEACASRHQQSIASIALAWLRSRQAISSVIIGARTSEQLKENLLALDIKLTSEEMSDLNRVGAPYRPFPTWMVERQSADRLPGAQVGLLPLGRS